MAVFRMRYYSGLSLLALVGIILAVGLVTSAGFFAQAVDRVMLQQELAEYTRLTQRPPFAARVFAPSSTAVPLDLDRVDTLGEHVADTLSSEVGLPAIEFILLADSGVLDLEPAPGDTRYTTDRPLENVSLIYMTDVSKHIETPQGRPFDSQPAAAAIPIWMHEAFAAELGVQIGDTFQLNGANVIAPLAIEVAGTWTPIDPDASYWVTDPNQGMVAKFLVRRADYIERVQPQLHVKVRTATWQVVLDETRALPARARNYRDGFEVAATIIPRYLPDARVTTPQLTLDKFVGQQTALTTLLLGFNVPALGFLLYFLVLTSAVIAYWQRRETALLRSRGITRGNILNYTMLEALMLFIIGSPLGLGLGLLLARMMGYSVSFLSFSWRPPLPVSVHGINLPLTLGTLGIVLVAKLWTVGASTGETVVSQSREHARPSRGPFWYRNYLDLLLVVPTFYAYRQLTQREWLGALVKDRPTDLYQDPLLILVPGLFIITGALLCMRIFPLLMCLLDRSASRMPWLASYLGLRQLGRQSHNYINPLLLVIVSLALGVYTLSMAASMDQWLADRVYYEVGADLTFVPFNEAEAMAETPAPSTGADWIPPIDEFRLLPGVAGAARVGDYIGEIRLPDRQLDARFVGVDRTDLPLVAWHRFDFARESLGGLMNRLAGFDDGILVPQTFLEQNNLRIGDQVPMLVIPDFGLSVNTTFTIVGTYEYFPTVYHEKITVIGNLEYIFSFFGVSMPHHIWLDLQPDQQTAPILEQVTSTGVDYIRVRAAEDILTEQQADMPRVGVFGTLTVSFLAAAVMAALGLLTYSYASLHERLYQFSVLRAVGLRRFEIVGQVILEYGILTAYGALAGVVCGTIAANLFVPLFRVSTGPDAPLPPLLPIIAQSQIVPLATAFASIMILLEVLIISTAFYRRLFEALRLGHHG